MNEQYDSMEEGGVEEHGDKETWTNGQNKFIR